MAYTQSNPVNPARIVTLVAICVFALIALLSAGSLIENVNADEILVVQSPYSGTLTWHTTAGVKWQGFGRITSYPKRANYDFETQVRFNDGGHGTIHGSVQWEMPLAEANLNGLHTRFGSAEAIQKQLIEKVVNKSVYMTGPLMSSKESYAEKRNYLINYVEDQIANGVYRTIQHEIKVVDPLTNQEKTAIVVDIQMTNGQPQRQEASALAEFGVRTFNFAINALPYDDTVEKQIQQQQQITMQVQTAIAESRQAEQRAITVEQQGKANAAEAKWQQEVIKAKMVTEAESRLAVEKTNNEIAEQYRQATLKRADADATYRKRVMEADGALAQRLDAQIKIATVMADAIKNHPGAWVPNVVMGQSNGAGTNGATQLIDLLTVQAARQAGLDK